MPEPPDAFEILVAADPVDETALPGHDSVHGTRLLAEILATPRPVVAPAPRRWARRPLATALGIAVLGVVTVAAAWLTFRPVTDPLSVTCYQEVRLGGPSVAVASGGDLDPGLCQDEWRSGRLANAAVAAAGEVPPLTACLLQSGALAVLPTADEEICDALGLDRPDPASLPEGSAIRIVEHQLVDLFAAESCIDMDTAVAAVERELAAGGLTNWTVAAAPATPERPCASFSLDPPARTVHLVPLPAAD